MDIKQYKQFLLSEIKVTDPSAQYMIIDWERDEPIMFKGNLQQVKKTWWNWLEGGHMENETLYSQEEYDKEMEDMGDDDLFDDENLDEGVDDFHIGQTSNNNGIKTTVKDVDNITQSVTWDVKKEVTDADIHKKMTQLINDFEKVKLKDFHSRPKLIQLVKDLKTIRNKFSRTIPK